MKKFITTNACYLGSMALGVCTLLCASVIENSANGWVMLGWTLAALALGGVALVLAALGVAADQPEQKSPYGRIERDHARNPEYPENQERGA